MNITLFYFLYNFAFQYQWLDGLIWFFAVPFIYIMMVVTVVYFLIIFNFSNTKDISILIRNKGKEIFFVFFSAGFAYAISYVVKMIVHADRPFIALANIQSLFVETGYAFPSSHSATISALAFSVFFRNKRFGYICMVAGLFIGLARVASGVHFPIDIIGGYMIGFLVAFLFKSR